MQEQFPDDRGTLTGIPSEEEPAHDMATRGEACVRELALPQLEQLRHENNRRVHENGGAADIGCSDHIVNIVGHVVVGQQIMRQNCVQQEGSCTTASLYAQITCGDIPQLLPRRCQCFVIRKASLRQAVSGQLGEMPDGL